MLGRGSLGCRLRQDQVSNKGACRFGMHQARVLQEATLSLAFNRYIKFCKACPFPVATISKLGFCVKFESGLRNTNFIGRF